MELMAERLMRADLDAFLARYGIALRRVDHPPVMTVEESERLVPLRDINRNAI